jgi:NitT/TauT family transport system substrate-binding protein
MNPKYLHIFIMLVLIMLSGCGKKTSPEGISEDSLQKVSIQLPYGIEARSAGYYAALNQGFYFDEGLEVDIVNGDIQTRPEDSVLSGKSLFGVTTLPRLIQLRTQNKPLTHLAQIMSSSNNVIIWKKDGPIKSPLDLLHHNVTLPPAGLGSEFYLYLAENRISPNNITISENSHGGSDLLKGEADMVMLDSFSALPEFISRKPENLALSIISASSEDWGLPQDCIFTSTNTFNENKELTQKFIRATLKGWNYVLTNPKESIALLSDYDKTNQMNKDQQLQSLREIAKLFYKDKNGKILIGFMPRECYERVNNLMSHYQIISKPAEEELWPKGYMNDIYQIRLE